MGNETEILELLNKIKGDISWIALSAIVIAVVMVIRLLDRK